MSDTRVWAIGLTRSGTTSLNRALKVLGYDAVHWPSLHDLLGDAPQAATDETVAACYKFLDARFPRSRFILNVRDEEPWLRSVERHRAEFYAETLRRLSALRTEPFAALVNQPLALTRALDSWLSSVRPYASGVHERMVAILFTQMQLYGTVDYDREKFAAGRRRHYADVEQYFGDRPGDLLRVDITSGCGWEPLCRFLDRPVPDTPFPHEARSEP